MMNVAESPLRGSTNRKQESSSWPPSFVLKWGDGLLGIFFCKWELTLLASKKPQFTTSVITFAEATTLCVLYITSFTIL